MRQIRNADETPMFFDKHQSVLSITRKQHSKVYGEQNIRQGKDLSNCNVDSISRWQQFTTTSDTQNNA
jgi:hypothetical protein